MELRESGEVATAKLHAPVLVQDGSLPSLDEAIGPSVARLRARVVDVEIPAGLSEIALEFAAAIGEHALDRPAGVAIERDQDVAQETRGDLCGGLGGDEDAAGAIGAGRIAGRDLPDLAHALELSDVEAVDADELAGDGGLDVALGGRAKRAERSARALRQQPGLPRAVMLEHAQPLQAGAELEPSQGAIDRAGRDLDALARELDREAIGTPGRPGQGHCEDRTLDVDRNARRPTGRHGRALGMQSIDAVALVAPLPAIEQGPRDPGFPAGRAHVSEFFRAAEDVQALGLYAVFEGHRTFPFALVRQQERRRIVSMALPRFRSEVSTPFGHSSV